MQIQLYNSYSKIIGTIEPALFKALRDSLSYMDGERLVHLYVSRQPGLGWCFPTGLIAQVIEVISMHGGAAPEIEDRRRHVPNSEVNYHWNTDFNLRAYQHTAVSKMVAKTRGSAGISAFLKSKIRRILISAVLPTLDVSKLRSPLSVFTSSSLFQV